jgi:peptidyl-prolyl cis-trans isomerase B (cyclophilin B)
MTPFKRGRLGPWSLLFVALVLAGCDHHRAVNSSTTSAGVSGDSDLTGERPTFPRALPVTQTAPPTPMTTTPPVLHLAATPTPVTIPEIHPDAPPATPPTDVVPTTPAVASTPPPAADAMPSTPAPSMPAPVESNPTPQTDSSPPPVATQPPAVADPLEDRKLVAVLNTSFGRIVIQLDDVSAPRTCGNFRKLVSDGFYNHTTFHRVIPNFIIQGGDPNSKSEDRATYGQGDPGYTLPPEIKLTDDAGAVAMARLPDSVNPNQESNGSQFFICVDACPSLDGKYTVFAHVIKGLDVARKIANQPRDTRDNPTNRIEMDVSLVPKSQALGDSAAN